MWKANSLTDCLLPLFISCVDQLCRVGVQFSVQCSLQDEAGRAFVCRMERVPVLTVLLSLVSVNQYKGWWIKQLLMYIHHVSSVQDRDISETKMLQHHQWLWIPRQPEKHYIMHEVILHKLLTEKTLSHGSALLNKTVERSHLEMDISKTKSFYDALIQTVSSAERIQLTHCSYTIWRADGAVTYWNKLINLFFFVVVFHVCQFLWMSLALTSQEPPPSELVWWNCSHLGASGCVRYMYQRQQNCE